MKTIKSSIAALLLAVGVSANAATTWDFVSMANSGEYGTSSLNLLGDGFSVAITGTKGGNDAYAYLDRNHGGLGVCGTLTTGAQCTPSNDDNVTTGEILTMTFDKAVTIDKIWFNNLHDGDKSLAGNYININGLDYLMTAYNAMGDYWALDQVFGIAAGGTLSFMVANSRGDSFYISGMTGSAVPLPAAAWLFGSAVIGMLGFARRRKQNVAAV